MKPYKKLSDLPLEIRDTGLPTFYPQKAVIDLLELSQDEERRARYFNQSLSLIDNIKQAISILSGDRIIFE